MSKITGFFMIFVMAALMAVPVSAQVSDMGKDVPKETITFEFFLVRAGNFGGSQKGDLPEKVLAALNEVAGLTRYKNFKLITAPVIVTREGVDAEIGGGLCATDISFSIQIKEIVISKDAIKSQIRISLFGADFGSGRAMSTALAFNEGEIVVIGVSSLTNDGDSDDAIMVAVTAKIAN